MLYEYEKKFYIKPLTNKVNEVKVIKKSKGFEIEIVGKLIQITSDMKNKMRQISIEEAYNQSNKKTISDKSF